MGCSGDAAYNAEQTLKQTYDELPHDLVDRVILVDDASKDGTVDLARRLDLTLVVHESNKGYGANQKTCYGEALTEGATIIVMVHPDYQYDPKLLPDMIGPIEAGHADVVLGSRMMGVAPYRQGMPWWKYLGNKLLTAIENYAVGMNLSEYLTGYRAYSRDVLEHVEFERNSDDFVFDQEIIVQIVERGYRIAEVQFWYAIFPRRPLWDWRAASCTEPRSSLCCAVFYGRDAALETIAA
jgi:glycosyltransferase involved in cell wall biosynthesis